MQGITENWFSTNPFLPLINNSAPIVQERAISNTPTTRSPPGFQKVSGISSGLHNVASTPFDLMSFNSADGTPVTTAPHNPDFLVSSPNIPSNISVPSFLPVIKDLNTPNRVKLPNFWTIAALSWFNCAEITFRQRNVDNDADKYLAVVDALNVTQFSRVQHALLPDTKHAYFFIKRALLRAFANPDGDKFEEINQLRIGNDDPIDFVNKMKSILGNDRSHPLAMRLMRIKLLNCLPCEVESALRKWSFLSFNALVERAGSLMKSHRKRLNYEHSNRRSSKRPRGIPQQTRAGNSRSHAPARYLSDQRPLSASGLCFYHNRFGRNAIRCAQPCAWKQKRPSTQTPCELPTKQRNRYADSYARNNNRRVNSHFFVFDSRNNINFLVDTSSATSVIPPLNNKMSLFHANPPISALTDTNMKAHGCQHMSVSLAGCGTFQWEFLIANVRHPILGLDFLDHFSVSIDIANRRIFRVPRFPRRVFRHRHKQPRITKHLPRPQMSTLLTSYPSAINHSNLAETRVNATTAQVTQETRRSISSVDVRNDMHLTIKNTKSPKSPQGRTLMPTVEYVAKDEAQANSTPGGVINSSYDANEAFVRVEGENDIFKITYDPDPPLWSGTSSTTTQAI
ncbi:uncharacterized protein LOC144750503 [Ciona intestinalis]